MNESSRPKSRPLSPTARDNRHRRVEDLTAYHYRRAQIITRIVCGTIMLLILARCAYGLVHS